MKKLLVAWLLLWSFHASAQTINNLNPAATATGTEEVPVYQGANPAVKMTTQAIANLGPLSLVSGDVAFFVNPSSSASSPCNNGSTCAPGSDSNNCLSISAPCQHIQHVAYLFSQTLIWGINAYTAKIILSDGTYNEQVTFVSSFGLPKASTLTNPNGGLEIVGDDANPANVVVSAPNGSCESGGVFDFFLPGPYALHGLTLTGQNETTYPCAPIETIAGTIISNTGTINLGPAGDGGALLEMVGGGVFYSFFETINITAGDGQTSAFAHLSNDAGVVLDGATLNFVGTNNFNGSNPQIPAGMMYLDGQSFFSNVTFLTFTGTMSGYCYNMAGGGAYLEGGGTGTIIFQAFPGCTVPTQAPDFDGVGQGANNQGMLVGTVFGTNNGQTAPGISGTGCNISDIASDNTGTITQSSGSTGCTLSFINAYPLKPEVFAYIPATGLGVPLTLTQDGSGNYNGFSIANVASGTVNIEYQGGHHF